jgi:hypothetical protein
MNENIYSVFTPAGKFEAVFGEEYTPVEYRGDDAAIQFFKDFIELNMISGEHGHRISYNTLEPDELYGFCQPNGSGITVIPPFDDMLANAREEIMEQEQLNDSALDSAIQQVLDNVNVTGIEKIKLAKELNAIRGLIKAGTMSGLDKLKSVKRLNEIRVIFGGNAKQVEFDPTSAEGYAKVMASIELQEYWQDVLDSFFQGRIVDVRNALRDLGWIGRNPNEARLYKDFNSNDAEAQFLFKQVGAGANVVGYSVNEIADDLTKTPEQFALEIDSSAQHEVEIEPEPILEQGTEPEVINPEPIAIDPIIEPDPVIEPTPVSRNPELDKQMAKLANLTRLQEQMKAANKILKSAKLSDEQKQSALSELGYDVGEINKLMRPDFAGRIGYSYHLTNNNAVIKNTQGRIRQLQAQEVSAMKAESGDRETIYDFDGGNIELSYADDRLRVNFDKKPAADMIAKLKQRGFKWSPTNTAWQRQLTDNAILAANSLFGTKIQTAAAAMRTPIVQPEPIINPQEVNSNIKDAVYAELKNLGWTIGKYDGGDPSLEKGGFSILVMSAKTKDGGFGFIFEVSLSNGSYAGSLEVYLPTIEVNDGDTPVMIAEKINTLVNTEIKSSVFLAYAKKNGVDTDVITPPVVNAQAESQGNPLAEAFKAELNALTHETNIKTYGVRIDEIYARIEKAGLADELDPELNASADVLTGLMAAAEKRRG